MSTNVETLELSEQQIAEDEYGDIVPDTADAIYFPICQRDPNDIRTILRLSIAAIAFAILTLALAGFLIYKLTRSPSLVVVERTADGDRVVADDQHYTLSGSVQLLADRPSDGDKKYLVRKWAESFFQIDPRTRRDDLVRGLKMMTPDAAVALVEAVKRAGEWETQQREEWQSVWKPQSLTISSDDPYKVQVIGQQEITKTIGGVTQHDGRQIVFTVALRPDTSKRTEDNQNTGFRVAGIAEMKVLPTQSNGTITAPPAISVATPQAAQ
ncbi:MAG TPA: hypothetical protein VJT15_24865 [Pyrinomonadaceae bacterium]|nr:hypothetical protein [Pyrinomonadaceae bacterium]